MRNALQQNMDVPSSESDFEDFGSVSSSSYTSSASLSDQPYEPHRGHYTHDYELTASESEKFPPSQSEESEEDDEENDRELQQGKKKSAVPLDTPLLVLKLPEWRDNWTIQLGNSTMERVKNPMKLNFLQNFRRTLLVQSNVLFENIPEFEGDYFGKYRVLIGQKCFENESTRRFVVVPNIVIGVNPRVRYQSDEIAELLYLAPSKNWYKLRPGKGRGNEYHIPAPLSKRQTLSTLVSNNFL